jgi:hypothetical protein
MILSSLLVLSGVFMFGFPFLAGAGVSFGWTHMLGSLLTFFVLGELFTGVNIATLVVWLFRLIY